VYLASILHEKSKICLILHFSESYSLQAHSFIPCIEPSHPNKSKTVFHQQLYVVIHGTLVQKHNFSEHLDPRSTWKKSSFLEIDKKIESMYSTYMAKIQNEPLMWKSRQNWVYFRTNFWSGSGDQAGWSAKKITEVHKNRMQM
jgi:hypothetical protein